MARDKTQKERINYVEDVFVEPVAVHEADPGAAIKSARKDDVEKGHGNRSSHHKAAKFSQI